MQIVRITDTKRRGASGGGELAIRWLVPLPDAVFLWQHRILIRVLFLILSYFLFLFF